MKILVLTIFLLLVNIPTGAWAAEGLCLPKNPPEGAEAWPICAVYMHGNFGSRDKPESRWEMPFREKFEQIALEKKCRIALPLGTRCRTWHWNGMELKEVKARARKVCDGAKFIEKPALIGFSNGANVLRKIARADCGRLAGFPQVTLIGPSWEHKNRSMRKCTNVQVHSAHEVPSMSYLRKAVDFDGGEDDDEGPGRGRGGAFASINHASALTFHLSSR